MPHFITGLLLAVVQLPGLITFYILGCREGSPVRHRLPTRVRMGTVGTFDLVRIIGAIFVRVDGTAHPTLRLVQLICRTLFLAVLTYAVWELWTALSRPGALS